MGGGAAMTLYGPTPRHREMGGLFLPAHRFCCPSLQARAGPFVL